LPDFELVSVGDGSIAPELAQNIGILGKEAGRLFGNDASRTRIKMMEAPGSIVVPVLSSIYKR
jgi:hypothetical protein